MNNPHTNSFKQHPSLFLFLYSWFLSIVHSIIIFLFEVNDNNTHSSVYTVDELFLDDQHLCFIETYDSGAQDADANANVDPEFYNTELYKTALVGSDNELEKKWKRNILYSNTPRGNIVMFYDAYKKGFAYYCDTQSVSANILNALAMKYVMAFRCRDLFMDNHLTPEERDSPLIQLQIDEENKEKEKKKESMNNINPDLLKKAPFAKLKKYNTAPTNANRNGEEKEDKKEKEEPHYTNKFIYLGKVLNFSFIQKAKRTKVSSVASSAAFQGSKFEGMFEQEHQLQKDVMSYKDFKKAMAESNKKKVD
jgi:hypothetical protein